MKKKIISFVLSMVAVLSVCTVVASAKCYFMRYTDDTGNVMHFDETMPRLGGEIFLAQGEKSFTGRQYSKVTLYRDKEGVNKVYCRVKNGNSYMSREFVVLSGESEIEVKYYSANAFKYKEQVKLVGKQNNVKELLAQGEFHVH